MENEETSKLESELLSAWNQSVDNDADDKNNNTNNPPVTNMPDRCYFHLESFACDFNHHLALALALIRQDLKMQNKSVPWILSACISVLSKQKKSIVLCHKLHDAICHEPNTLVLYQTHKFDQLMTHLKQQHPQHQSTLDTLYQIWLLQLTDSCRLRVLEFFDELVYRAQRYLGHGNNQVWMRLQ